MRRPRSSAGLWLGEVVATFGLLTVILGVARSGRASAAPFAVGGYIGAAYWFTSSTKLRQSGRHGRPYPDRQLRRDRAVLRPMFVVAQVGGGLAAVALALFLHPTLPEVAERVILPHDAEQPDESRSR